MHYVYAIKSRVKNYIYVGMTSSIERRLSEHNSGRNKSTKPYLPFDLIYSEECENRTRARTREKVLKSGYGKEFLKTLE